MAAPTHHLLQDLYQDTRQRSVQQCEPLQVEDYGLQAEPFTSPPKWHLAHTTWFFETFLLKPFQPGYEPVDPIYEHLFNSYYNGIGQPFTRAQRGLLSRPTVAQVHSYRRQIDEAMLHLLNSTHSAAETIAERVLLGVEHEKQHQELFFTDLKYSLFQNPMAPAYHEQVAPMGVQNPDSKLQWLSHPGGLIEIGATDDGFAFDNELPRHQQWLQPFELANRLATNGDYQGFIDDGGYQRPELWLADGWACVQEQGWTAPLYWCDVDGAGYEFSLHGKQPRQTHTPVCHVSGYEADAFARWSQARLPTEAEWEVMAASEPSTFQANGPLYHPQAAGGTGLDQLYSDCWQWTQSAYSAYPGFETAAGAIGEYNGKFMSNQWVLRGGSCVTSPSHVRPSYRNFFYPPDRWQFSGIRLARSPQ